MNNDRAFLGYCPKCGDQGIYETGKEKCHFCGTTELPTKYDWDKWLFEDAYPSNLEEIIFNEYIKDNPEFDEELYAQREGKEKILQQASLDKQMSANKVTCPYCKSTNTKKITNTSKAVHTALFGIFSISRNSKQWHCNSCGSDF